MRAERLLYALGDVQDEYIEEAYSFNKKGPYQHFPAKGKWVFFAAAAAVVAVMLVAQLTGGYFTGGGKPGDGVLPALEIDTEEAGSYGFEGYQLQDPDDMVDENPWTEDSDLKTLPVFENTRAYFMNGYATRDEVKKMEDLALEVANRLEMDVGPEDIVHVAVEKNLQGEVREDLERAMGEPLPPDTTFVYWVTLENNQLEIQVDKALYVSVQYKESVVLPEGLNFSFDATYEEMERVADYLLHTYEKLLGMQEPVAEVYGGDYAILEDGEIQQRYQIRILEGAGNLEGQILGYNFHTVRFSGDDQGGLSSIGISNEDIAHKIGDYPLITGERAEKMLREGQYVSSAPYPITPDTVVVKKEILYRLGHNLKVYVPYYRFIVELPTTPEVVSEPGLKSYGAYYVPALEPEYIQNMPLWENNFNT